MVRKSSRNNYTGFSIQKAKVEEIKKFIKENPELNYKTVIDFINEAIKEKLNKKITVVKIDELKTIKNQLHKMSTQMRTLSGIVKENNKTN